MQRLRLRAIKFNVDFRKTEMTNYEEFSRSSSFPGELRNGEAYLFVSKSLNQMVFVTSVLEIDKSGRWHLAIDSRKWRLQTGTWNPLMLADYASEVGLKLDGIKKFGELFDAERERKTGAKK